MITPREVALCRGRGFSFETDLCHLRNLRLESLYHMRLILFLILLVLPVGAQADLSRQVEIIRTAHGVPHIRAENFRAAGYALAWIQCEDYGTRTPLSILSSSGRWSSVEGTEEHIESDFFIL